MRIFHSSYNRFVSNIHVVEIWDGQRLGFEVDCTVRDTATAGLSCASAFHFCTAQMQTRYAQIETNAKSSLPYRTVQMRLWIAAKTKEWAQDLLGGVYAELSIPPGRSPTSPDSFPCRNETRRDNAMVAYIISQFLCFLLPLPPIQLRPRPFTISKRMLLPRCYDTVFKLFTSYFKFA